MAQSGSSPVKIYIILLNWQGWKDTLACLESLRSLTYPNFQVIVCDNDSRDASVPMITDWIKNNRVGNYDTIFLPTGHNLGFASGNNVGIRYALGQGDAKYLWLLNNDTEVTPGALTGLVNLAECDPQIGMVGSKLLYYHQRDTIQAIAGGTINKWKGTTTHLGGNQKDQGQWNHPMDLEFITGASLLVRSDVCQRVGLMEEGYFLYAEEVDWCLRVSKAGWSLRYCPGSEIFHKEGGTVGKKSYIHDYYYVRNMLHLMGKFFPVSLVTVLPYSIYRFLLPKLFRLEWARTRLVLRAYLDFFAGRRGKTI